MKRTAPQLDTYPSRYIRIGEAERQPVQHRGERKADQRRGERTTEDDDDRVDVIEHPQIAAQQDERDNDDSAGDET